jgi:hypothetical protein
MASRNRFLLAEAELKAAVSTGSICVFVSHQREDIAPAKALADYLLNDVQVDVYFDGYDQALTTTTSASDEAQIVDAIEAGLTASTHLLAVLSAHTRGSWWVPFEFGSARGRDRPLAHILLDNVQDLPSFLLKSKLLVDQVELASWARKLKLGDRLLSKSLDDFEPSLAIPRLPNARLTPPLFMRSL